MIMEMIYMKKIIMLVVLVITIMSCSELSEMEARHQQRMKERGWECMYNHKGEIQGCNYIN